MLIPYIIEYRRRSACMSHLPGKQSSRQRVNVPYAGGL